MTSAAKTTAAEAGVRHPNSYDLSGGKIKVSYSETSFGGQPLFHYEDGTKTHDFKGKDI
ncbi:MAG: hypothetical protein JOZ16_05470 [Methylobacteriaceae bacterium]|nr:hypothetical protein [Methylobacteriaceae bacterium]